MKILVTGGSGFIGGNLSKRLIELGHEITITRFETEPLPHIKIRYLDQKLLLKKSLTYDCVFHLAANNDTLCNDKKEMYESNVFQPIKLFYRLYENGCKKFIYASSTAVYGNMPPPFSENKTTTHPLNVYAESKVEFENFAKQFAKEKKDVSVIGLRYCNIYGSNESRKGRRSSMIYQIYNSIKNNQSVKLFKYGEQKRDWCYVKDVVQANINCLEYKKNNIFNIAGGCSHSFNKINQIIENYLNKKSKIEYIDCEFEKKLQTNTECCISQAKKELNWTPKYNIEQGIKDYINFLEESFT